jgi:hypothetical protein
MDYLTAMAVNGKMFVHDELETIWKEGLFPIRGYYPRICLVELSKTRKYVFRSSQDST